MPVLYRFIRKITIISAVVTAVFGLSGSAVLAAEPGALANGSVIESPGLLPTNPFYFLKRFRRLTQRAITVTPEKKMELELNILNQKAAEIKRMMEISESDREVLNNISDLYEESLNRLRFYLDNADAGNADVLLNKLLETGFKHFLIFNHLETDQEILTIERLENLQFGLAELIARALVRLDNQENSDNSLTKVLEKQGEDFNQLIFAAVALDRLQEKAKADNWLKIILLQKQAKIFLEAQVLAESGDSVFLPEIFENLPGNRLRHIKIIDALRELPLETEIKNQLAIIRQRLFDLLKDGRLLNKSDAESTVGEAAILAELLELRLKDTPLRSNILNQLLLRAKFNLDQADFSFESGQYGEVVGQASVSSAASRRALVLFSNLEIKGGKSLAERLLKKMKNEHDALDSGIKDEKLSELLAVSEKLIVKISGLVSAKTVSSDSLISALEEAQFLLLKAKWELKNVLRRAEETAASERFSQPFIERVLSR